MNQILLGATIASLRKQKHMTQAKLSEMLNVSHKTISKWETGLSYPEISLLPRLASVFGVTVDYLLSGERNGIAVAGNLHWDTVQYLDADFREALLANATATTQDVGGCVPIITLNLAKIDPSVPLFAVGCIGSDENGRRILARLQRYYIQTGGVTPVNAATGTNNLIIAPNRDRFQIRSMEANALFDPTNIDIASLNCRIFHFDRLYLPGYWEADEEYGYKLARVLHNLQEVGILTSICAIHSRFRPTKEQLTAVLKYCDYVITGTDWLYIISEDRASQQNDQDFKNRMQHFLDSGVSEKVCVFKDYNIGYCLSKNGQFSYAHMPEIGPEDVKSTKGFSDEIIAGCLYGFYQGYSNHKLLEFALATTVIGLTKKESSDGMRAKKEILQHIDRVKERAAP